MWKVIKTNLENDLYVVVPCFISTFQVIKIIYRNRQENHVLTDPEGVGEPAVDSAVELLVERPEDAGAQLNEVDDEPAHHKHEAHKQLQDEQALQVGQQSHGGGA